MPEISVIVPVYNVEKYINRCVESILNQTYIDFELILVDDGSPDNCPQICDDWAKRDNRIKVIHQTNNGQSAARNTGIRAMRGEYLLFVDSDDFIHPQMLEILFRAINDGNYDISVCALKTFCDENEVEINQINISDIYFTTYKSYNIFSGKDNVDFLPAPFCKLYKKEIFERIRFVEGIIYEDLQIMPYILLNSDTVVISDVVLYYYFSNVNHISTLNSSLSERKLVAIDIAYEHLKLYISHDALISAQKCAYKLFLKFVKLNVMDLENTDIKKIFRKKCFSYIFKVLSISNKYLSVKNKLIFLLSFLKIKRINEKLKCLYSSEFGFDDKNNL